MKSTSLALTAMLAVAGAAAGHSQQPAMPDKPSMMADRQQMMAMMQSDQAAEKRLEDLVAQLNAARGNDRLDKVIAVVNELAAQRKSMHGMMRMMMSNGMMSGGMTNKGDDHSTHHPEAGK
jgi:hypothetical protein